MNQYQLIKDSVSVRDEWHWHWDASSNDRDYPG